jgi:hypothetical protein
MLFTLYINTKRYVFGKNSWHAPDLLQGEKVTSLKSIEGYIYSYDKGQSDEVNKTCVAVLKGLVPDCSHIFFIYSHGEVTVAENWKGHFL